MLKEMIYFKANNLVAGTDSVSVITWDWTNQQTPANPLTIFNCGSATDPCKYLTQVEGTNLLAIAQPTKQIIFIVDIT